MVSFAYLSVERRTANLDGHLAQRDHAQERSGIEIGKEHGRRIGGCIVRFALNDGADRQLLSQPAPSLRTAPAELRIGT